MNQIYNCQLQPASSDLINYLRSQVNDLFILECAVAYLTDQRGNNQNSDLIYQIDYLKDMIKDKKFKAEHPSCKHCGSSHLVKCGIRNNLQYCLCKDCRKKTPFQIRSFQ